AETIANRPLRVLNLFAYTGGATLAAAAAGAQVTHVDAAKSTIAWARENAKLSGLSDHPIRWIEDDALKFVLREAKRGNTYDGIILDPPRFGRGTKGEVWKIEVDLPTLLTACRTILSKTPQFFCINAYTADLSALVMHQLLTDIIQESAGIHTCGELALKESGNGRLVPNGIFARWNST
ncbi:MAG: class I SAM-dependent methyltransferase, partial [Patescibacteria group bacterium]